MSSQLPLGDKAIQDLYPSLDAEERPKAAENLDRYLELALRIFERVTSERSAEVNSRSLTAREERSTIPHKKVGPRPPPPQA